MRYKSSTPPEGEYNIGTTKISLAPLTIFGAVNCQRESVIGKLNLLFHFGGGESPKVRRCGSVFPSPHFCALRFKSATLPEGEYNIGTTKISLAPLTIFGAINCQRESVIGKLNLLFHFGGGESPKVRRCGSVFPSPHFCALRFKSATLAEGE